MSEKNTNYSCSSPVCPIIHGIKLFFKGIIGYFKQSKLARALLFIVVIKIAIFYGFFKAYLFPTYLKPKWESEQHRIDDVTESIIKNHKTEEND